MLEGLIIVLALVLIGACADGNPIEDDSDDLL